MAVKEVGLGLAIDILQELVDDSIFTLSMEDVRGAVKTIMADWSYWKDRSYEFQPVSPSDPVNGMSTFMEALDSDEGAYTDFAKVLQCLTDHEQRLVKLETRPKWLIQE